MRRWYLISAGVLSLALLATLGPRLLSGGKTQDPPEAPTTAAPKAAKSRIDKVTVYPTNALVTREVEVPAGAGLIELVIAPMPDRIVPNTMYSEGSDGLRVLTTRFSTRQVFEDTSDERRKLEAEMEKYQVVGTKIDSEIASLQKNMELLTKLEAVTQQPHHTGDSIITMTKYVMEQRTEKAKEMVAIQEQKRQNGIQIGFLQRKMGELGRGGGKMEREAILVVDREKSQAGKVRLNYLVSSVTWHPEYKIRAGKAKDDIELDYLAGMTQHSGEDWSQVKMTLSTAQPALNSSPPELCMLQPVLVLRGQPGAPPMPGGAGFISPFASGYSAGDAQKKAMQSCAGATHINQGQAPVPAGKGGFGGGGNSNFSYEAQKEAGRLLNEAAAIEQNLDLMQSREEVLANLKGKKSPLAVGPAGTDGPSVTYHLTSKLTVPSRNDEQMIEVIKLKLAPKFYYKTVPVLNAHVYRLADLCNTSEHILLPGEATMYQGTDFVGRMPMPLVAVGEEFTAGFGVDTQLQVQRQMVDQVRSTAGGNQVLKYDYRILVSSFKKDAVQLQVWDRLPKGETESVNVIFGKTNQKLCEDGLYLRESRVNNLLRWDVEIPANVSGEKAFAITYDFRMELDRQMAITGFQSK